MQMQDFAREHNLAIYLKLLAETTNLARRKVLLELLRQEETSAPKPERRETYDC